MKVLFVDFGYIMYPSIKKYANELNKSKNEDNDLFWNQIDIRTQHNLIYDAGLYEKITKYLFDCQKSHNNVVISDDHLILLEELEKSTTSIEASVIDFYSGFATDGNDMDLISLQHKVKENDWLSYLAMKGIVASVDWYKTPQSDPINQELNPIAKNTHEKFLLDIDKAFEVDYDMIYVTCSKTLPYQFKHLYDVFCYALSLI